MGYEMRGLKFDQFEQGQKFYTARRTVTEADVATFAGLSGDYNPLHTDAVYMADHPFKKRIAHGMLSAGLISAALGTRLAAHGTVIYLSRSLRFLRPVFPGDTVTAKLEVTGVDPERQFVTCATECVNQDGRSVLTGEATVLLEATGGGGT